MDYREFWREDNESVRERYELSAERIASMETEETAAEPYRQYFVRTARFIRMAGQVFRETEAGAFRRHDLAELQEINGKLYEDILPEHYRESYADPSCAVKLLGPELGAVLSYLYTEIRGQIAFAHECRLTEMTILNELFIEIYNLFESEIPSRETLQETIYWFVSDYADLTASYRIRETLDPSLTFARDIVMESDLSDARYLYYYGEYVSEEELSMARFMNGLPQATIDRMADTYTEGYRKGFEVMGRDLSAKKTVQVLYPLGFERMVRKAIENFRGLGLEPVLYRKAVWSSDKKAGSSHGYSGTSPNRQYDYDHRYDNALYLQKAYTDRKLAVQKAAYETYKKEAAQYGGPALIDTFGEAGFHPVNKPEALALSAKQEKLMLTAVSESARLSNQYVPGSETSFTIIAFPKPEIGPDFEEIFEETIRINTLDYERYKKIQQKIVDRLDLAEHVIVTGRGDNHTHMKIMLHRLERPEAQTNFENCLADVNIPLGEVFTSPVLTGTEGVLEVSSVYLYDIQFKNLRLEFHDGRITDYSCGNFPDEEEGRKLIKQRILKNHETLPIGEFAIGTNTAAYTMAQRFGIVEKLPILIVEKMGPHFAVGDTCYNWSEDVAVYNPDGKEIIARDNEISILRKEDVSKAYFSCHTDITIPYSELGDIYGVTAAGEKLPIIESGRFAVPGTELLNEVLRQDVSQ